jgi:Cu/Ag efflux pump CusA
MSVSYLLMNEYSRLMTYIFLNLSFSHGIGPSYLAQVSSVFSLGSIAIHIGKMISLCLLVFELPLVWVLFWGALACFFEGNIGALAY